MNTINGDGEAFAASLGTAHPQPSPQAVQVALDRIVASSAFAGSERRQRFLRFVVEETLAGRADRIKAYAIALEVFERDASFDPQTDPIVRIEAGRLRRRLEEYYQGPGRDEPLRIEIAKGAYVPTFRLIGHHHEAEQGSEADAPATGPSPAMLPAAFPASGWRRGIAALALLAALALAAVWWRADVGPGESTPATAAGAIPGPSILILPFTDLSPEGDPYHLASGIAEDIRQVLLRFKELTVFDATMNFREPHGEAPLQFARRLDADYVLAGSMATEGDRIRLKVQLVGVSTGATLWGEAFEHDLEAEHIFAIRDEIAGSVARTVAQPYGVIFRDTVQDRTSRPRALTAYDCVILAYEYRRELSSVLHDKARTCLEQAVQNEPYHAQALTHLALVYLDEYRFGYNPRPDADPLADALALARRAVELTPDDAVAFQGLFNTYIFLRQFDDAFEAAERALAANPDNPEIQAIYGLRLALFGNWGQGLPLVRKAIANNPAPPGWYFFPIAFDHYRKGEIDAALREARRIDMPAFPYTHLLLAAIHARRNDVEAAGQALDRALEIAPHFAGQGRELIAQQIQDSSLLEMFITDLRKAGLDVEAAPNTTSSSRH